jgi:hypothetical protein
MIKQIIISLLFILSSAQLWADCGDPPDLDSNQKGVTVYQHTKTVFESGESGGEKTKAYDNLIVWMKDLKGLCFSITTISHQLHQCFLDGKATAMRKNEYSYTQNECRVFLSFMKDKVKVKVVGSRGNFCVAEDLGEDNGCGMNTSIDSAIYKVRKKLP